MNTQPIAWHYQVVDTPRYPGDSMREVVWTAEDAEHQRQRGYEVTPMYGPAAPTFDMLAHLQRQREWSGRTFGPGPRTAGVIDHIRKELREIEADPTDLSEWIDVVILALDGAWRAGGTPEQIIATLVAKQTKNEGRTWPDWRTADPDKAIEHDRAQDAQPRASNGHSEHPDDAAVDRFATAMKEKLAAARAKGRGGWHEPDLQQRLSDMLREHVDKGDPRDVANFACFLFNRGETIAPAALPASNNADTLSQALHGLHTVLYSGDWHMPDDTHAQLEGIYEDAKNGLGTGFIDAALPAVPPDDDNMVVIETVGVVREREDGSRYIDWTLEGGIHGMEVGDELTATSRQVTNDEGYGEVYQRPQDALPAVPSDWALVPEAATHAMILAGVAAANRMDLRPLWGDLEEVWNAMLAAAPAHDQPEGEG